MGTSQNPTAQPRTLCTCPDRHMITPRSALKFDLFADASRQRKIDEVGDPLQTIA